MKLQREIFMPIPCGAITFPAFTEYLNIRYQNIIKTDNDIQIPHKINFHPHKIMTNLVSSKNKQSSKIDIP